MFKDPGLESDLRRAISMDEPEKLLARFATLTRESGTPDEHAAGEYIAERLRALGVPVAVHRPDLFLSIPERSEVRLKPDERVRLKPDSTFEGALDHDVVIRSRPPSFALSTNGEEVAGDVCYVPAKYAGGTGDLFDTPLAAAAAPASDPVAGQIVLTEGYSMPGTVHAFERRGAVAQIFIHPGADIHEGICTPIWGAPTPESLARKPRTPVVCVNAADGA